MTVALLDEAAERRGSGLADDDDDTASLFADEAHRGFEFAGAGTILAAEEGAGRHVAETVCQQIVLVHAHEHRFVSGNVAADEREVFAVADLVGIDANLKLAAIAAHDLRGDDEIDELLVAAAIADEVADRGDLQPVLLGELHEVRHSGHGAIVVHDLADHARGVEAGEPRDIDRSLGVAGADHHAAVLSDQREDVPGGDDVVAAIIVVDGNRDGAGAVGGRDAGGDALARLDGDGEGRLVLRLVLLGHRLQAEIVHPLPGHRQTNEPAPVLRHEIDDVRARLFGRYHEVTLVLAILVVDENEHATLTGVLDHLFDRGQPALRGL